MKTRPLLSHTAEVTSEIEKARVLVQAIRDARVPAIDSHLERALECLAGLNYEVRLLAATVVNMTGIEF